MSSNIADSANILVSCKQTRFHIESPCYQELDIQGLNITVASSGTETKPKGKAKADGLELLTNATFKLKPGVHYALVGRNGTGKSTLLRAVAQKLIPGIPLATRIAILQQTAGEGHTSLKQYASDRPVLQEVIAKAISKDDIQREIDILSAATESVDPLAALRGLRRVKHLKVENQLFELDKDARLRSGARGYQARKVLVAFEKKVADSLALLEQKDEDIDETKRQEESQEAIELLEELQAKLEPTRMAEVETKARKILVGLGFTDSLLAKSIGSLSGGWHMRMLLATALLAESDILILDEPTNFLDLLGIMWLENYLINMRESVDTTVVLVSHDRYFVNNVCEEIIVLKDKDLTYFRGNIEEYEKDLHSKKLYYGRMKEALDKQKAHVEKTIQNSMKAGKASGDDKKIKQAKSRQKKLDERMGLQVNAKGGRFKLNRDLVGFHLSRKVDIEGPQDESGVFLVLPSAPDLRFPGPLVSLENISLKFKSAEKPTIDNVSLTVHMGDRIGIMGLNGSGKTGILRLVADTIKSSSGTSTRHPRLRMGYYSQHSVEDLQRRGLEDLKLTALSALSAVASEEMDESDMRGLLGLLGLHGRTASDVPLSKLSGGQLVRAALSLLLWRKPQLLVLDEITTHLDYHTVNALGDALANWNGAILLVSHDRFFVRRVIEGEVDDDDEETDSLDEDEAERRRLVYLLKGGKLTALENGVTQFEASLEKRVKKLLASS